MGIMLRVQHSPAGFIAPCLPTKNRQAAIRQPWLHEIKHDGFRIIARKNGERVRLYSRPGNDLTRRFPLIVETLARLRAETRSEEHTSELQSLRQLVCCLLLE